MRGNNDNQQIIMSFNPISKNHWLYDFCEVNPPTSFKYIHSTYKDNPFLNDEYIRELDIDLTLSGHAHGGQWRVFGRGVFAPGQGILPKYTSGMHENRFIVSRGLANNAFVPRLFNSTELIFIEVPLFTKTYNFIDYNI